MKDACTVIDRTNQFYIEMSKKMLSEKEYEILQKLLIEKMNLQQLGDLYGVTGEYIHQIYERTYQKVKSVSQGLGNTDEFNGKLEELKKDIKYLPKQISGDENEVDLQRLLTESHFAFGKRLLNIFDMLEIHTMGEFAQMPLREYRLYRGFGMHCKKELIAFIEFENIEHLFKGFSAWKRKPTL